MGHLLNNYEISPSYSAQTDLPYSPGLTGSTTSLLGVPAAIGASYNGSGGSNRLPTLARNAFSQNRTQVLDMRLSKRFTIAEKAKVELLGESFNLANHVNETSVNTTSYAYAAGKAATATTAATPNTLTYNTPFGIRNNANNNPLYSPRQIQLGVRVQF